MAKFVPFFLLALAVLAAAHPLISPDEALCEDEALPGGFSKAPLEDSTTQRVIEAVADEYIASSNGTLCCFAPYVEPLQACQQVVAGTNYEVLLHLTCPEHNCATMIYGTAFVPLPSANAPVTVEVEEVEQV